MIDKIEDFLYDFIGLVVPGLILIVFLLFLPVFFIHFNIQNFITSSFEKTIALDFYYFIYDKFNIEYIGSPQTIFIVILLCYILGHVIKVFSKYQYDFFYCIFDKGINKLMQRMLKKMSETNYRPFKFLKEEYRKEFSDRDKWYVDLVNLIFGVVSFLAMLVREIFSFKSPPYYNIFESLKKDIIKKINSKYDVDFPDKWYAVYKISNVVMDQEKLKSLSPKFLAKYNFYRSMAFLFSLNFIYTIIFFCKYKLFINMIGFNLFKTICLINAILWITFHTKYKRYWTLCGNESLVSLFYYLNKPKKNNEEEKNNG